jgi:ketosteroid isomerase-like protein|eukprot:COSAG06_NODE_1749_length_8472_cov_6.578866_13_plen_256_part_00
MGEAVDDQDAVAAAAIFAARAESNVGFTSHDVEPIKNQWLPTMLVTQATLGEHTLGASANAEMLADMFATRDQVLYSRTPTRVTASTQLEMAAEMGRWQGRWLDADGASQGKSGVYFAQWRLQPGSTLWLLNAEVFVPVAPAPSTGDVAAEAAIRTARASSNAAIKAHDIDGIAAHWLPDVHVTHSNGSILSGAAANREMFAESFAAHADLSFDRRTETVLLDVDTAGGVAAELGTCVFDSDLIQLIQIVAWDKI